MALFQHAYGPASTSDHSEKDLVERVRAGDQLALEEIFHKYYDGLCRFTLSLTHSRDDVEDLVQDIFVKIWIRRALWSPKGSISAYLFKAARNQSLNFLKSKKANSISIFADEESLPVEEKEDLIDEITGKDAITAAGEAIQKLPERCRLIFTLNRQEGLTYSEIADVLGISEKTVENQVSHALKTLRKALSRLLS